MSNIYTLLASLEDSELVTSQLADGKPNAVNRKRYYTLTDTGMTTIKVWRDVVSKTTQEHADE